MLPKHQWLEVIQRAPLVSIDLIASDAQGRVLLGYRNNEPARHRWFVPGGAIRKNERLDEAFARIARTELGLDLHRSAARLLGVYEHFYSSNFAGEPGISTHYIVLAHEVRLSELPARAPLEQHRELRTFTVDALLQDAEVHEYTKAYFRSR